MRDRWLTILVALGVLALFAGGIVGVAALRSDPEKPAVHKVQTRHVVSEQGGFELRAPTTMRVKRQGRVVRMTSGDRTLVVTAGPSASGPLKRASRQLVARVTDTYTRVDVLGRRTDTLDGRAALTTYGQATSGKVRLRFVLVVVAAKPRNYAITTFTAADSDPGKVLPLVNAISASFHVLAKKS